MKFRWNRSICPCIHFLLAKVELNILSVFSIYPYLQSSFTRSNRINFNLVVNALKQLISDYIYDKKWLLFCKQICIANVINIYLMNLIDLCIDKDNLSICKKQ